MFDLQENLKRLPDLPGVYIHKDEMGNVIYVGKAVSLKKRVRQYFRAQKNMDAKVRAMVGHIAEFEYITCATEAEALILECNLIKKYMPKYNVLLRDDKTYPYIKITAEEYPRIIKTRQVKRDGGKYFGPYSDAGAVNVIVDLLNDFYKLKHCATGSFPPGTRACLNYHIGKCRGVCIGGIDREEYGELLSRAAAFLSGRRKPLLDEMRRKMEEAAAELNFEEAALYRDKIAAAETLSEIQRVAIAGAGDMDMVLPVRTTRQSYAVLFSVRGGRLSERETFRMQAGESDGNSELVAQFLMQHYTDASPDMIPHEIIVEELPEDSEPIENCLTETAGKRVRLIVPKKGDKRALLELARRDVLEMCKSIDERARAERERISSLNDELCKMLSEAGYPCEKRGEQYRVEAYDISNTSGVDTVAAMVVFSGLRPAKKDYRRFKIRSVDGPDDYTALKETVYRRFRRAEKGDLGFAALPDIILMDGGKGQVSAALQVLEAMKLDIPVFGMAKDEHHRTRALVYFHGGEYHEAELAGRPLLFKYMGTIQEEVHRFAIDYHRKLRGRRVTTSALDNIDGVGPVKRNALLAHFGGVEAIRQADAAALTQVPGINERLAENIIAYFKGRPTTQTSK